MSNCKNCGRFCPSDEAFCNSECSAERREKEEIINSQKIQKIKKDPILYGKYLSEIHSINNDYGISEEDSLLGI